MIKPNRNHFKLIIKAAMNPELLDVEVECKINEAYEYMLKHTNFNETPEINVPTYKLTGHNKDKETVEWYKKNKIINKIRSFSFY